MRQSTILAAASIFATLGSASEIPHNRLHRRNVLIVTETTVVTDWSTVWVTNEPAAPTVVSAAAVQQQQWHQPQGGPPASVVVPTSQPAAGAPSHTAAPVPAPAPSSVATFVPPMSSTVPVVPAPSSSAPAAPASGGGTAGTEANLSVTSGTTYSGIATYYDPNGHTGSCGPAISQGDPSVAVSHEFMTKYGGSNSSPLCRRMITINYNGKSTQAKVMDTCESCDASHIDLPRNFYDVISNNNEGPGHVDVTWSWN